jgi:ankyrin repeat protein
MVMFSSLIFSLAYSFRFFHLSPMHLAITSTHHNLAIENYRTETALMLIEICTNVEGKDKYGDTPLIFATKENCLNIVEKLILYNANVNAKDKTGVTPLLLAILKGHDEIAIILIDSEADLTIKNKMGITPLLLSIDMNRGEIAIKLIVAGTFIHHVYVYILHVSS